MTALTWRKTRRGSYEATTEDFLRIYNAWRKVRDGYWIWFAEVEVIGCAHQDGIRWGPYPIR
jgi:hypothetical protein